MATFHITVKQAGRIEDSVQRLADRIRSYNSAKFPLTHDELELMLNKPNHIETLHQLQADGACDLPGVTSFIMRADKEAHEAIRRTAAIIITSTTEILATIRSDRLHYSPTIEKAVPMPLERLPEERRVLLAQWVNRAVRGTRQAELICSTVREVLNRIPAIMGGPLTTTNLLAAWPGLVPYITDETLKVRLRARVRRLPEPPAFDAFMLRRIAATEALLAGASMLPKSDRDAPKPEITGMIQTWARLPDDPVFAA